jgi:hypothetical protein
MRKRRRWQNSAKSKTRGLTHDSYRPDLCAEFQRRYGQGGTIQQHAKDLGIATRTAYRWAEDVRIRAADRFKRHGLGPDALVRRWVAVVKKAKGHVLNRALMEVGAIMDVYPPKKQRLPPQEPVTLIFNSDLTRYDGDTR